MALEYSFDPRERIIRIIGHGAVSVEDRIAFVRGLLNDPELPSSSEILIDVDNVTNMPTAEDVGTISLLVEKLQSRFHGRVAILNTTVGHVTVSQLVALGVGDGVSQVLACTSEAEALEWLRS